MATTYDPANLIAPRPPLGWNSYNTFGGVYQMPPDADPRLPNGVGLSERVVLETAEAVVSSGLRDCGYIYINLDDRWQDPRRPRDADGVLRVDARRFPNGIAALADRVHALGLKFGLYTIGNVLACGGEEGDGPGGIPRTGSLGRETLDAYTFAQWGVDFLKIDWCGYEEAGTGGRARDVFEVWNHAIAATGRPILLSASTWGYENEPAWAPGLAHMWRTSEDLPPNWEAVHAAAVRHASQPWAGICGPPTGWNDPDMLEVGRPGLNDEESWTHLVLSAMTACPLLMSHDVRNQSPEIRAMLGDADVLAIAASGAPPATHVTADDGWGIWRRELESGRIATAVVNLSEAPRSLPRALRPDGREVRWGGQATPQVVAAHGVHLTVMC
jgi:alpha-galactosidase